MNLWQKEEIITSSIPQHNYNEKISAVGQNPQRIFFSNEEIMPLLIVCTCIVISAALINKRNAVLHNICFVFRKPHIVGIIIAYS